MVRWLQFRLGTAALWCAFSGCAVVFDGGEIGEPLETPAADRPGRITDANAPAAVTATESERGSKVDNKESSVESKEFADENGLEQLIAQGRRQGTLSTDDEARLRKDMAAVPPELRRQIVSTFVAMNGRNVPKPDFSTKTDESRNRAVLPIKREEPPAIAESGPKENPLPPPGQPVGPTSAATPHKSKRTLPKTTESASVAKANPSGTPARTAAINVAVDEATGGEWQVMLAATIRSLEESLASPSGSASSDDVARRQAQLRMLYLIAGRRDDALRPIVEAEPEARQFWTDWLYGTAIYLDPQTENPARRATLAVRQLEDAVSDLAAQANLEVCNLAFCRRVTSFGVYEAFGTADGAASIKSPSTKSGSGRYVFGPNQEVLLYAEVRNFTSRHTERGYHTALRPSYQIFDAAGRRLGTVAELGESQDFCQHRRRDFFVRYHLYLPSRIDPGDYKLKLTIEDIHSTKVAEGSVEFSIGQRP
jgi:hypothetical protein